MSYETTEERELKEQIDYLQNRLIELKVQRMVRSTLKAEREIQQPVENLAKHSPDKLLNREKVAEMLGIEPATLAVWASTKRHRLPFIKVGRLVKYRYEDVMNFLKERIKE